MVSFDTGNGRIQGDPTDSTAEFTIESSVIRFDSTIYAGVLIFFVDADVCGGVSRDVLVESALTCLQWLGVPSRSDVFRYHSTGRDNSFSLIGFIPLANERSVLDAIPVSSYINSCGGLLSKNSKKSLLQRILGFFGFGARGGK
jgi:hypothetical protein